MCNWLDSLANVCWLSKQTLSSLVLVEIILLASKSVAEFWQTMHILPAARESKQTNGEHKNHKRRNDNHLWLMHFTQMKRNFHLAICLSISVGMHYSSFSVFGFRVFNKIIEFHFQFSIWNEFRVPESNPKSRLQLPERYSRLCNLNSTIWVIGTHTQFKCWNCFWKLLSISNSVMNEKNGLIDSINENTSIRRCQRKLALRISTTLSYARERISIESWTTHNRTLHTLISGREELFDGFFSFCFSFNFDSKTSNRSNSNAFVFVSVCLCLMIFIVAFLATKLRLNFQWEIDEFHYLNNKINNRIRNVRLRWMAKMFVCVVCLFYHRCVLFAFS